mgnify:CR=1 FL=1
MFQFRSNGGKGEHISDSGDNGDNTGGKVKNSKDYCEFDVHVHKFANLAKQSIHMISSRCSQMYMAIGFVIEGRDDSELPEALFACVAVNKPQEERGEFVFEEDVDDEDE